MSAMIANEQAFRERECVHRDRGAEGNFYQGASYVQSLQRLRGAAAARFSNRVTSFFWSDADRIVVWLCHDCAGELNSLRRAG